MNFRDHLLHKITIDELSARVARSLRDPNSGKNFDKETMRQLLSMGPYRHQRERDMDLFVQEKGSREGTILVLDNGLAIYRTTMEDVILRKNPTVKEMVSIRNAIKILNDKDVVISRKVDSVKAVRQVLMDELNLDYEAQDIEALAKEGRDALGNGDASGVEQSLRLFAELLGFVALPKAFRAQDEVTRTWGHIQTTASGAYVVAPVVVYYRTDNTLKLVQGPLDTRQKGDMDKYQMVLTGEIKADIEGTEAFGWLQDRVLSEKPSIDTTWQQM